MKCILVVVISKDWFITNGEISDVAKWTSDEDKIFFSNILKQHNLCVFGRKTFEAVQAKAVKVKMKVVLTKNPQDYKKWEIKAQLEFHNLTPEEFVNKYKKDFSSCLILGGSKIYKDFLDARLVDEILITIEPIYHKQGLLFPYKIEELEKIGYKIRKDELLNHAGTRLVSLHHD